MDNIKIYAFADEASGEVDGQIRAAHRNSLSGIELREQSWETFRIYHLWRLV